MKKYLIVMASTAMLMASAQAQTIISEGPAGKTYSSGAAANNGCKIDSQCNVEKYGGHHSNASTYSYSYSYSYGSGSECAGLSRLEAALCRQGQRMR
jgi:hypothetical protein